MIIFVVSSSGCTDYLGSDDSDDSDDSVELVESGNVLNYQYGEEEFELVFHNEKESSIEMTLIRDDVQNFTISKEYGNSGGSGREIFFGAVLSRLSDNKADKLMNEGQKVTISEDSNSIDISRSQKISYYGLKPLYITINRSDQEMNAIVHISKPYIYLNSFEGFNYTSMKEVDSAENYVSDKLFSKSISDISDKHVCQTAHKTQCQVTSWDSGEKDLEIPLLSVCKEDGLVNKKAIPFEIKNASESGEIKVICG